MEVDFDVDKRPKLSSFFHLYSLVQDADIIMFLYRDSYYSCEIDEDIKDHTTELIIAKNCHGDIGTIELDFDDEAKRFIELHISGNNHGICYT